MDFEKEHLKMLFFLPKISITGMYTASGRVLLLPVTGSGPSNITVREYTRVYLILVAGSKRTAPTMEHRQHLKGNDMVLL